MSLSSYPARAGLVLSAFMSAAIINPAFSQTREIPESLYERYGKRDRSDSGVVLSDNDCSRLGHLSEGRVLQNDFANGHGRSTISLSNSGGGTVQLNIELSTSANGLPQQSCGIFD